jgi:hypothetical protein
MIIGVPVGHVLYLVGQERRAAKPQRAAKKAVPVKEGTTPQKASASEGPTPKEKVGNKVSRGFALFCGYERLKARHALMLLILRTSFTWILGSAVLLICTKLLKLW